MNENNSSTQKQKDRIVKISGMYEEWFLDYASYVNLERSIPDLQDGFKPVQRRIMQSMKDLDDSRYNKVANLVGHTMQYHPHGDSSIGDAMVQIGQKDLLIDMQGNWGNIFTGDRAAAPRYIEARLSPFSREVLFNPKITAWKKSYDGRKDEPIALPVKFPLLLAQGTEGIGVGIATTILPHNFNELLDASVRYLKGQSFELFPDFPTGGIADCSNYNDGQKGGKVKVRARIEILEKQTLIIKDIPFATTTTALIDSILSANDKGKIKIKKIEDNTAAQVAILVHLPPNVSPDKTMDALYAFTKCEISISPICCVIDDKKPVFTGVSYLLKNSTDHTVNLLKKELEITLSELENKWHFESLERIFIENRIYRDIEEVTTWEAVLETIATGLKPFTQNLKRPVSEEDIISLTEIKIKRISKFDLEKYDKRIADLESDIETVQAQLENLITYAIDYFKKLKKNYGKTRTRKTELASFEKIVASKVVIRNLKLYADKKEGFIGTALKKEEYICDCSGLDDIIVFLKDGRMTVTKVTAKTFISKDILHVAVFKKGDKRTVYNMIYRDGRIGASYIKRFCVSGVTRDKIYELTQGNKDSKILYFSANTNGEAEIVTLLLRPLSTLKKIKWDIDFSELMVKGRGVRGNLVTRNVVKQIRFKTAGVSTLAPRKIWFDDTVKKINTEERGKLIGAFTPSDKIIIATQSGKITTMTPDLNYRFPTDILLLEKWDKEQPISVIYFNGEKRIYFVKRFLAATDKEEMFIPKHPKTKIICISSDAKPVAKVIFSDKNKDEITLDFNEFISVKSIRAMGNQLTKNKIKKVTLLTPKPSTKNVEEAQPHTKKLFD